MNEILNNENIEATTHCDTNNDATAPMASTIDNTPLTNKENIANKESNSSTLTKVAKFFSAIFSPLLVPTYGVIIALNMSIITPMVPFQTRLIVTIATLAITCLIPATVIAYLFKMGIISDLGVNQQKDRLLPYGVTILCYIVSAIYLSEVNAPVWIPGFIIGGGIAAIVSALVNIKWKISAHGAAMGGLVALIYMMWQNEYALFDFTPITCIAILCAGIVGSSRIILNCHTLGQVLAGTLNGIFWVTLMTL